LIFYSTETLLICYISAYPRSGNAFTRNLIYLNFGLVCSNGHAGSWDWAASLKPRQIGKLVGYTRPPHGERLAAPHNTFAAFESDPGLRRECAAHSEIFLVKTLGRPIDNPIAGERYIQTVRHPVCAIAGQAFSNKKYTVEQLIEGRSISGDWSGFHRAWQTSGMPGLTARFEDIVEEPAEFIRKIGQFLKLECPDIVQTMPSSPASRDANGQAEGLSERWRKTLSDAQAQAIWSAHGPTASEMFGYSNPGVFKLSPETPSQPKSSRRRRR
jgi:hypothetical protein